MSFALVLVAGAVPPATAASPACMGVRFLVERTLVSEAAAPFDVIVIGAAGDVTIASGCPAAPAHIGRRNGLDVVRARWAWCGALRNVRLNARLDDPACTSLDGTLSARGIKRQRFTATASTCGDGLLDLAGGETCETSAQCADDAPCVGCVCDGAASSSSASKGRRTTTTSTSTTSTSSTSRPSTSSSSTTSSSTSTSTSSTRQSTTTTTATGATTTLAGRLFEASNPWNTDVSTLPKSAASAGITQALAAAGGWGFGSLRIDFSIEVLEADASTPVRTFTPTADFYSPDCDHVPFPVPVGGALEGETGYQCVSDGDCHLIVVNRATKTLYEMWRANILGTSFTGGCGAVWDLTRAYPETLRGDQCTSADAGGFPIAAMLFSADEVASGAINHAIRFILPNSRMRAGVYVRPASHAGGPTGGSSLPPYGVRFRLRSDFPMASLPTEGARVVARAMQRYGMLLADGGNIALTAQSDRFTTHKWSEVGVDTRALQAIAVSDMEVVDLGTSIPLTYDCVRNP